MLASKLKVLQYVLTILEIETKGRQLLLNQVIYYGIKIIHTKNETYRSLVDKENSNLFMVDIDQLFIFKKWHHTNFIRIPTTTEADILYNLTEDELDILCTR